MAGLFVLFNCSTEPFVTFVRILDDQSATRIATFTKLTHAVLLAGVFFLCLSKHVQLLKCLLHSSQGILHPAYLHGGLTIQSLHVCSQVFDAPYLQPLLQPSQTYRLAIAPVRLSMTR